MYVFLDADPIEDAFKTSESNSYIRILHAVPNAPAVDVYADGKLLAQALAFKKITQYLSVPHGNYTIRIYPAGQKTNAVLTRRVHIPENAVFTVAATGILPNISLFTIHEHTHAQTSGKACVRFVHLSPNAPAVDVKLADGKMVFDNVSYKGITNSVCLQEGNYSFKVTPASSETTVLNVPNVTLTANTYHTVYAVGLVGKTPPLEALIETDPR
ncbi:MAG: DUF4397 domain-containing protein [Eubacteriales bacterium]